MRNRQYLASVSREPRPTVEAQLEPPVDPARLLPEPSRDPIYETIEQILDRTAAVLEHMAQGFRTDQETIRRLRRG